MTGRESCSRPVLPLPASDVVEERSATVPGGALRIRLHGPADGARLLLLHGGPGLSDRYLDGLVDEFADGYRVATYAQRGVAPSTAGAPYDLPVQAADVVAVLEELGWTDAVVLGHSFGGHLLLHVLAEYPGRLRAAVPLDPLGGVGDGGGAVFQQELLRRLSADDRVRLERPGLTDAEQLEILWPAYFPPTAPAPAYATIPIFPEAAEAGFEALFAALPTLAPRLRDVTTPTRFVVGEGSPMPESASTDTAALFGARVVRVPGGHFPWLQHPGVVRTAVDDFLSDLARGGTPG